MDSPVCLAGYRLLPLPLGTVTPGRDWRLSAVTKLRDGAGLRAVLLKGDSGLSGLRASRSAASAWPCPPRADRGGQLYRIVLMTLGRWALVCIEWAGQGCPRPGARPWGVGPENAGSRSLYRA